MPFDETLADRIRKILKSRNISEKKMFGGICFMDRGNMFCGVEKKRLMVRVGPDQYQKALTTKHAKPMDLTGVPLKGFVFVAPTGLQSDKELRSWLKRGLTFTKSLPPKEKKTGKSVLLRSGKKLTKEGPTPLKAIKNFGTVSRSKKAR